MYRRLMPTEPPVTRELLDGVRTLARPLRTEADLDPLIGRIGDARYVLLGEASHGTHEFYTWRAAISQRLIEERGFSFIAVEGDWPDCYRVNRYAKGYSDAGERAEQVLHAFERWPTWMWANEEVVALTEWLRAHNEHLPDERKVGFYGMDVYSLWDSLYQVMDYLKQHAPHSLPAARQAFRCFEPYGEDVQQYARATQWLDRSCESEVVRLLSELRGGPHDFPHAGEEARFNAEQNALIVRNAEHYYRTMVRGGPDSWNIRDRHMVETLERLMRQHGPQAKCLVWAHNTHLGDARYTDMATEDMVNVGQLVREAHAREEVVLVGFAAHRGSVIAAPEWEGPIEQMPTPPGRPGSWEDVLHRAEGEDRLLLLDDARGDPAFTAERGHRAIGVVYQPHLERFGNYVPTILPRRYDALLYFDQTAALRPLHFVATHEMREAPETYPFGV